jgi:hypothetical protein
MRSTLDLKFAGRILDLGLILALSHCPAKPTALTHTWGIATPPVLAPTSPLVLKTTWI